MKQWIINDELTFAYYDMIAVLMKFIVVYKVRWSLYHNEICMTENIPRKYLYSYWKFVFQIIRYLLFFNNYNLFIIYKFYKFSKITILFRLLFRLFKTKMN